MQLDPRLPRLHLSAPGHRAQVPCYSKQQYNRRLMPGHNRTQQLPLHGVLARGADYLYYTKLRLARHRIRERGYRTPEASSYMRNAAKAFPRLYHALASVESKISA